MENNKEVELAQLIVDFEKNVLAVMPAFDKHCNILSDMVKAILDDSTRSRNIRVVDLAGLMAAFLAMTVKTVGIASLPEKITLITLAATAKMDDKDLAILRAFGHAMGVAQEQIRMPKGPAVAPPSTSRGRHLDTPDARRRFPKPRR